MNRRTFISSLAAFTATAVLDPEKLLWRAGAKTISIPPAIVKPPTPTIIGVSCRDGSVVYADEVIFRGGQLQYRTLEGVVVDEFMYVRDLKPKNNILREFWVQTKGETWIKSAEDFHPLLAMYKMGVLP